MCNDSMRRQLKGSCSPLLQWMCLVDSCIWPSARHTRRQGLAWGTLPGAQLQHPAAVYCRPDVPHLMPAGLRPSASKAQIPQAQAAARLCLVQPAVTSFTGAFAKPSCSDSSPISSLCPAPPLHSWQWIVLPQQIMPP